MLVKLPGQSTRPLSHRLSGRLGEVSGLTRRGLVATGVSAPPASEDTITPSIQYGVSTAPQVGMTTVFGKQRVQKPCSAAPLMPVLGHSIMHVPTVGYEQQGPVVLLDAMPDSPTAPRLERVPTIKTLLHPRTQFGVKMFAAWAPKVATAVLRGTVLDGLPDVHRRSPSPPPVTVNAPRAASDEWDAQRRTYHCEVVAKFAAWPEFVLPPGSSPGWRSAAPDTSFRTTHVAQASHMPPSAPARRERIVRECMPSQSFTACLPVLTTSAADRVLVWGDGSFDPGTSSAGSGIFYAVGDRRNRALRVPGDQTSDRAELWAFLHCIEQDNRALLFVTDSRYVHDGVTHHRHKWRSRAWFLHPLFAEYRRHADLWRRADAILNARGDGILTCWGRGHARRDQAAAGETTDLLCMGNCYADALSKLGAQLPLGGVRYKPRVAPTVDD
eukprot:gene17737-biopygen2720